MFLFKTTLASITNLLKRVTENVLRAKIVFFDANPVGRILTRFSKDVVMFDMMFPMQSLMFLNGIFRSISVVITVCVINPYVLIPALVLGVLMFLIMKVGMGPMADGQIMDSLEREPIHNTFSMMINGLVSCRVAEKIPFFKLDFMNSVYRSSNSMFCCNSVSSWIGLRLDLLCTTFTSSVCWFCIVMKGKVDTKILIVTLQLISDLIAWFSYSVRLYADLSNQMTSSQRMFDYTSLEIEDELKKPQDKELQTNGWPTQGVIEYKATTMRYREQLPPAIKDLTFRIEAGMKVGIVGRTGSGKSSILQTLFRLVDLSQGQIFIDGIDITQPGMHLLRKQIAFIPQSPFLIQGTIRENLDPFNELSDEEIAAVIHEVNLKEKIDSFEHGINTYCSEANNLFSAG